jgi:hypothetical protein
LHVLRHGLTGLDAGDEVAFEEQWLAAQAAE